MPGTSPAWSPDGQWICYAREDGAFASELVAVTVKTRAGEVVVDTDEAPGKGRPDKIPTLKPAFSKDGTITAANASQISDGGSAVVLMSEKAVNARGVTPLGQFVSYGMVAGPDNASLLHQPSRAIQAALARAGKTVADVDLFEINEAFASVVLAWQKETGADLDKVKAEVVTATDSTTKYVRAHDAIAVDRATPTTSKRRTSSAPPQ